MKSEVLMSEIKRPDWSELTDILNEWFDDKIEGNYIYGPEKIDLFELYENWMPKEVTRARETIRARVGMSDKDFSHLVLWLLHEELITRRIKIDSGRTVADENEDNIVECSSKLDPPGSSGCCDDSLFYFFDQEQHTGKVRPSDQESQRTLLNLSIEVSESYYKESEATDE